MGCFDCNGPADCKIQFSNGVTHKFCADCAQEILLSGVEYYHNSKLVELL